MELNERETLIRVDQQLKDSVNNQSQIMKDLKEILHYIGTILLIIWSMKFCMCIIQEIFPWYCKKCGRRK